MSTSLALLILIACLSGAWVTLAWRKAALNQAHDAKTAKPDELRTYVHAASAGLVLVVLLIGLDNHNVADMPRLVVLFFAIATGMLLFLKRQRLNAYPHALAWLHGALGLAALILAGLIFV